MIEAYFNLNTIYIIESLTDNEIKTGTILYNEIIKILAYKTNLFYTRIISVQNKTEFIKSLQKIEYNVGQNYFPLIHFEIHGEEDKKGLVLSNRELVTWEELSNLIRPINIATKNNLIITMAVCFGAFFWQQTKILEPAPFFGCLAPITSISGGEIMERFSNFYTHFFNTTEFNDLIKIINNWEIKNPMFKIFSSIDYYLDTINSFEQELLENSSEHQSRIHSLANSLINTPPITDIKRDDIDNMIKKLYYNEFIKQKEVIKRTFLLTS
jgi:hypothetical protein